LRPRLTRPRASCVCAGHGAKRQERRSQPATEREPGIDQEVQVLRGGARWWEPLAEQQLHRREAVWGGSRRQSRGPRNTNRIRGGCGVGERARTLEARRHPDRAVVCAAGMCGEGHASYPGRLSAGLRTGCVGRRSEGRTGGVSRGHSSRLALAVKGGPNTRSPPDTERSMRDGDAERRAEKPERSPRVGRGTAERGEAERQAGAARDDDAGDEDLQLCARENMGGPEARREGDTYARYPDGGGPDDPAGSCSRY